LRILSNGVESVALSRCDCEAASLNPDKASGMQLGEELGDAALGEHSPFGDEPLGDRLNISRRLRGEFSKESEPCDLVNRFLR